jgi:membrane protein YdbS with pleckstrin-like domain
MAKVCEVDKEFEGTTCKLDRRLMLLWMFPILLLLLLPLISIVSMYLINPTITIAGLGLFWVLLFALIAMGVVAFVWFVLRYNSMSYTITKQEIIIGEGVINKKRTVIPFMVIQDIYVRKPLLYRLLGISLIEIETAGGMTSTSEGFLPGIANGDELVRDLLGRVRALRPVAKDESRGVLLGILEELKALRERGDIPEKTAPRTSNLEKEIAKILEAQGGVGVSEGEKSSPRPAVAGVATGSQEKGKKPKVCLPVETAEPDKLEEKKRKN